MSVIEAGSGRLIVVLMLASCRCKFPRSICIDIVNLQVLYIVAGLPCTYTHTHTHTPTPSGGIYSPTLVSKVPQLIYNSFHCIPLLLSTRACPAQFEACSPTDLGLLTPDYSIWVECRLQRLRWKRTSLCPSRPSR